MNILSLDVSAASTGWCVLYRGKIYYGMIKTKPTWSREKRLLTFKEELCKILKKYKPKYIVIEDIFVGLNATTIKVLAEFAGIAKLTCYELTGIEPFIISNNTVKAYYKAKKKVNVFDFLISVLEKDWEFKKDNDIVDALAQLFCYCDIELEHKQFRFDQEYGYTYIIDEELTDGQSKVKK